MKYYTAQFFAFWVTAGKTVPQYYRYKVPEAVKIELKNLPEGSVALEVFAENCYGMQSQPITAEF